MKIIHCADIHLDSNMMTHLSAELARERNIELLKNFEQMVAYGVQHQIEAVLIAGDLFDTTDVTNYIKNSFLEIVERNESINFYYVDGNHDRNCFMNEEEVVPKNFHVFEKEWNSYTCGGVTITGISCLGDSLFDDVKMLSLEPEQINIVMLHGMLGERPALGKEDIVPKHLLVDKNIDYLALGHVHSYEKGRLDARGSYCYSGCLEGRGFDECGQKGLVLLDVDEYGRTVDATFVPFGKRMLHEIEVNVSECMTSAQMLRRIEAAFGENNIMPGDMVKVILVGAIDVECEKNILYLRYRLEEKVYCFLLEDKTSIAIDYSDYVIDETLKGELVRTVQGAEELTEEEKAEVIRYGILALAGEEIAE